ncbi:hypothetical protein DE146DRAFT_634394 [Phaeosphaeria sp. MPI-PUGE-AT-0046c]|nr:hypothetical protein DE146DRAFT_634394 [Phaeosphaeria sp. MPI-PUGE-AT-0046c]
MDDTNPRKRPRPIVGNKSSRGEKGRNSQVPAKDNLSSAAATIANPLEDLQRRLTTVEELLGIASEPNGNGVEENIAEDESTPLQVLGTVVVKGNRSVYHGQNDRAVLLNQFSDVKDFIGGMSKYEHLQASAKQIKFLQTKSITAIASPESTRESEFSLALIKLQEYLPPRSYCDRLVNIYWQHFERTMRVLHLTKFMREYDHYWMSSNRESLNPFLVPQLTAMMAMAYHMDKTGRSSDDHAHRVYLKGPAVDLVQGWVDELSRKQRTELPTLQVETLLLLAKSLRGLHPEKLWSSTGALVRSAMVMGLHIAPSSISGFTPFQAEMRRRLWATTLEIDLQACVATTFPLVLPDLSSSLLPSNLDDTNFDEESTSLPASRSLSTYTDNIYQVVLASSLPLRLKAVSVVQHSTLDLQESLKLGRKIVDCIDNVPAVVGLQRSDTASDSGSSLHRVLLDLYLRRPLLCLYKPLLLREQQESGIYAEMERRCLDSSLAMLSYQELYTMEMLKGITNSPMAHQDFFYRCCKTDMLWAALTCCQRIKVLQRASSNMSQNGNDSLSAVSLIRTVENTIQCLIDRVGRKGSDLKDIVVLALALRSVQHFESPAQKSLALQETVEKTLTACRSKLLQPLLQSEHVQEAPLSRSVRQMDVTPPISNPRLTPISGTLPFPVDLMDNAQQWFVDLPDLAAEYSNFQAQLSNPDDALNLGDQQDWDWEQMWQ